MRKRSLVSTMLYACFLLSGASGLIFEVLWMRKLSLVFGNTVHAVSTVVAVFMGGLALGSWLFGRAADRSGRPLVIYLAIEIGIAVSGLAVSLLLLPVLDNVYITLNNAGLHSGLGLFAVRLALSVACMLVPTALMGGTLPVVGRFLVRTREELGARIAVLYGMNTLGAVAGTVAAGFWLIALFGESGAVMFAVCANLAAALLAVAVMLATRRKPAEDKAAEPARRGPAYPESSLRLVPLLFGLSGFASLAYQVLWTRALVYFVGLSVHAFTIILASFLVGIAIGSFLITRFVDRIRRPFLFFGLLQWVMALSGVLSIPIMGQLNRFYQWLNIWLGANTWNQVTLVKFFIALAVLGLPTLAMGAAFPLVNKLYIQRRSTLGRGVGVLYASNTFGTILGSAFAGFALLPLAGITGSLLIVAGLNAALAIVATLLESERASWARWLPAGGSAVLVLATVAVYATGGLGPVVRYSLDNSGKEILYYDEGVEASVAVLRSLDGNRELNINGESTAYTGFDDIVIHKLLTHLPVMFHDDPESMLVVGFGFGSTVWTATRYDLPRLDCVELVPEETRTAGYFLPENHGVLDSTDLVRMIFDDGRNLILTSENEYDIISFNAIHPKLSPMLYTYDFYRLCRRAMKPGATICAWLPTNGLTLLEFKSLLRSFVEVFPHSSLWWCNPANVVLLGVAEPYRMDYPRYRRTVLSDRIAANLAEVELEHPLSLATLFIMGEERLRKLTADAPLNTDSRPVIEFSKTMAPHVPVETYHWMMDYLEPITGYLEWPGRAMPAGASPRDSLEALRSQCDYWYRARKVFYEAKFAAWTFSQPEVSSALYRRALSINPGDDYIARFASPPEPDPDSLETVASADRDDFIVRYQLGQHYFGRGLYDRAARWFHEVTRIRPEHAQSWFQLGVCYHQQGNSSASQRCFERTLELNPASPEAMINLGLVFYRRGDLESAEALFQRAINADPGNGEAIFNLGNVRLRQNQDSQAMELFREAIDSNPFMYLAHLNLGVLFARGGEYREAVSHYLKTIELAPGMLPAYNNLILAYEELGEHDKAQNYRAVAQRLQAAGGRGPQ